LLVFAAAVEEPGGERKIVGSVQDVSHQREWVNAGVQAEKEYEELTGGPVQDLCHDISGPLTSILLNCELLMEGECPAPLRNKVQTIFSEAMQIDHHLRSLRR
jgi:hypothetical protein